MIEDRLLKIPAHGSQVVIAEGHYIGFIDSDNPNLSLSVRAEAKDTAAIAHIDLMVGDKLPDLPRYSQIHFNNNNDESVLVRVVVGTGRFDSDRLAGQVSINGLVKVDQVQHPVIKNREFTHSYSVISGSGQYASFELYNPVGSGVDLKIISGEVFKGAVSILAMKFTEQMIATGNPVTPSNVVLNKKDDLSVSKGLSQSFDNLSEPFYQRNNLTRYSCCGYADGVFPLAMSVKLTSNVVLGEGERLVVYSNTVAAYISGIFHWEEVGNAI
jgi:hypothetical protein